MKISSNSSTVNIVMSVFVALIMASSNEVRACSCFPEAGGFLYDSGVELPFNAVGIPWWGPRYLAGQETMDRLKQAITITRIDTNEPVAFELTVIEQGWRKSNDLVLVAPDTGWVASAYRFSYDGAALLAGRFSTRGPVAVQTLEVSISDESLDVKGEAFTLGIGPLERGEVNVAADCGLCSTTLDAAFVMLDAQLSDSLARWKNVLLFSTKVVNYGPWHPDPGLCTRIPPGMSWVGRGSERLYMECGRRWPNCEPYTALPAGRHETKMIAWLPGTNQRLTATEYADLTCAKEAVALRACTRPESLITTAALSYVLTSGNDESPFAKISSDEPALVIDNISELYCTFDGESLRFAPVVSRLIDREQAMNMAKSSGTVEYISVHNAWGTSESEATAVIGVEELTATPDGGFTRSSCLREAYFQIVGSDWTFMGWGEVSCS